ncbi:MAG: hypothetical protein K0R34_30 [Herbinix sp.]|nr:hypothetical protein [Herbinix sp.]
MVYTKRIGKVVTFLCALLVLLLGPTSFAMADMGPKPEILVKVINPPEGNYYLDLLIKEDNNYKRLELDGYDPEKIKLLESYNVDGWKPGLVMGTPAPMWGDLVGIWRKDGVEHRFGYMGVPDDFKLIIVTPDNTLIVSEEIHRRSLKTVLVYDYKTDTIHIEHPALAYIKQFLGTCLVTLFIEGILLLVFGFSLKRNWIAFLSINVCTQVALTLTIGVLFQKEGLLTASIVFFPVEFIIIITESILFALFLKEHSRWVRVMFAIFANVLSAAIGLAIMIYIYP